MTPIRRISLGIVFCLSLLYLPFNLQSQEEHSEAQISLLDRMQAEEKISLQILTNIDTLYADWLRQSYHWGEAKLSFANGEEITEEVKVKIRGKYRSRHCENPPIKIKYSNKSLKKRNFKKLNEFKLVYPCESNEEYQTYVLKEYLIYKLYNKLTDNSLRVQLVDFSLKDSLSGRSNRQFTGFLIEDREELIQPTSLHHLSGFPVPYWKHRLDSPHLQKLGDHFFAKWGDDPHSLRFRLLGHGRCLLCHHQHCFWLHFRETALLLRPFKTHGRSDSRLGALQRKAPDPHPNHSGF